MLECNAITPFIPTFLNVLPPVVEELSNFFPYVFQYNLIRQCEVHLYGRIPAAVTEIHLPYTFETWHPAEKSRCKIELLYHCPPRYTKDVVPSRNRMYFWWFSWATLTAPISMRSRSFSRACGLSDVISTGMVTSGSSAWCRLVRP